MFVHVWAEEGGVGGITMQGILSKQMSLSWDTRGDRKIGNQIGMVGEPNLVTLCFKVSAQCKESEDRCGLPRDVVGGLDPICRLMTMMRSEEND